MNNQEKLEQATDIIEECHNELCDHYSDTNHLYRESMQQAAARILEMDKPKWYYPEKGELPDKHKPIWGVPVLSSVAVKMVFYGKCFFSEPDSYYDIAGVKCWMPDLPPTPPTERRPGDE